MAHSREMHSFLLTLVLSIVLTSALETLDSEQHLERSVFGRPWPYGGIELLQWYVQNCLDNHMMALCDPAKGEYGFNEVMNFGDRPLLPVTNYPYQYYGTENIGRHYGRKPKSINKNYNLVDLSSNMARIVVNYNTNMRQISDIYLTVNYDPRMTYRIGHHLIASLQQSRNPRLDL